jgi:DNA-binding IclR family transcriptional regulator
MNKSSNPAPGLPKESSADRLLAVLGIFTQQEPEWTIEEAAKRLQLSIPTAYRYFKSLARVGLISAFSHASYVLGPAIIELDRQVRLGDPLLIGGRPVMEDLIQYANEGAVMLLCRVFRDRVICVHQLMGQGPQGPVSYERGRPMPLFRGASSKIILAHMPMRVLKRLFSEHGSEIKDAGLGTSWEAFKKSLAHMRRLGSSTSESEIDRGRLGIAAPIFGPEGAILGSLTFVLAVSNANDALLRRLIPIVKAGAHEIELGMAEVRAAVTTRKVPRRA